MAWLNSFFEGSTAIYLIAITVGLVVVLLGLFWVFRKIAGGNSIGGIKNRRPRLGVTEAAIVDDKRRLVLVRRDNVEHLVMIGGASDVLVERNIVRVQPATGTVEPIRAKIAPDEAVEDEISEQSEMTDTHDDVPPPSVRALASGAAATAAVVASVETALSKADDVPAEVKPIDDVPAEVEEDSEFTAAVADTLAEAPKIESAKPDDIKSADAKPDYAKVEDVKFGDKKPTDTGSFASAFVKTETKPIEAAGPASEALKQPTDTISNAGNNFKKAVDMSITKAAPTASKIVEAVKAAPQESSQEDKSAEAEDVEIKKESISGSDADAKEAPSKAPKEEPKAPEVVPPFEVAAAVSHDEQATPSATKPKEGRSDDMEDEMQKLLSELAGERRG